MSRSDELEALAVRCEREEPSRELDAAIDGAVKFVGPEWHVVTTGDSGDYRAFKGDAFIVLSMLIRLTPTVSIPIFKG